MASVTDNIEPQCQRRFLAELTIIFGLDHLQQAISNLVAEDVIDRCNRFAAFMNIFLHIESGTPVSLSAGGSSSWNNTYCRLRLDPDPDPGLRWSCLLS